MKVLVVGLGSIAKKHVAAIRKLVPDAQIYALRSSKTAAETEDIINVHDIKATDAYYDFAIISNPTSKHAETIEKLIGLNIPLFIEKPAFGELGHEDIIERVRESGVITYVGCNLRFLDSVKFLHDYIKSHPERRVNEVNVYCGSYLPGWRPGTDYRQCYSAIPELGGGVNMDLIHDIDYIYWIFGKPQQSISICRNVSSLEIRAFDYANYLLLYPEFAASIVLNYYRRDYKRTIEVVFKDDTWLIDLKGNVITDSKGDTIFRGSNTTLDTYEAQMAYFINLILNREKAENDIEEAYNVLKICLENERPKR